MVTVKLSNNQAAAYCLKYWYKSTPLLYLNKKGGKREGEREGREKDREREGGEWMKTGAIELTA